MKKTELILVAIFILGLVFMAFCFPGDSLLMIIGAGLLACLYTFFGFALLNDIRFRNIFKKESYKGISTMRMIGAIGAGLSLAVALEGILFKLMFWPGAGLMIIDGIAFLVIILAIAAIRYFKSKAAFYPNVFKRSIIIGAVAVFLYILPAETLANFRHRDNPEYAKALIDSYSNPDNIEYQQKLREEREKMDAKNSEA